jgi:hypothetical protein
MPQDRVLPYEATGWQTAQQTGGPAGRIAERAGRLPLAVTV